ncbi:MAG: hypothetical protein ACXW0O_03335 [Methylosarcina sp.]
MLRRITFWLLTHIGEPVTSHQFALARGPPDWLEADFDQTYLNNAEPVPEFEFDQTVSWYHYDADASRPF